MVDGWLSARRSHEELCMKMKLWCARVTTTNRKILWNDWNITRIADEFPLLTRAQYDDFSLGYLSGCKVSRGRRGTRQQVRRNNQNVRHAPPHHRFQAKKSKVKFLLGSPSSIVCCSSSSLLIVHTAQRSFDLSRPHEWAEWASLSHFLAISLPLNSRARSSSTFNWFSQLT